MSDADGIVIEMRRERRNNILGFQVRYEQTQQKECGAKGVCLGNRIALWHDSPTVWWCVPDVFGALLRNLEGAQQPKGSRAKPFFDCRRSADIIVQPAA